jgi:adenine phosphoribosyltransferase
VTEKAELAARVSERLRDVPDFPKPGILFKDITPVLADADLFRAIVEDLADEYADSVDIVAGIESRGFILAAPLAARLGTAFVPIRKPGKLPYRTVRVEYELEYGSDALEAHVDAVAPGQRVLIVDDVLATGGTAAGAVSVIRDLGGIVAGVAILVELDFLRGRERLRDVPVRSTLRVRGD